MSEPADPRDELVRKLQLTQDEEIDCDRFIELLAAYVDDGLADARIASLMRHHEALCPECAEELDILRRGLGV